MKFWTNSPAETERLGQPLGKLLEPGQVVALQGPLGAGKTALIRGIARGLGVTEPVTSPTYTIVNEYSTGRVPLFHFDMYRLSGPEDLFDIGWEDYLDRDGVCVVEWSERVLDALEQPVSVCIEKLERENARKITIKGEAANADFSL